MPITDHQALDALCEICGITLSYYDIRGTRYEASSAIKQSLLAAMDLAVGEDDDVQRNLERIRSREWQSVIAPTLVQQKNSSPVHLTLTLNETQVNAGVSWELQLESGQSYEGQWHIDSQQAIDECAVNEIHLKKFDLSLDAVIDIGYHQLIIRPRGGTAIPVSLIITPATCYLPTKLAGDGKIWGLSLQLYTLRSRRNWGIGDFADLQNLIDIVVPLGVDVIGLNPLHALYGHMPEKASPYSPSSRDFLNPIYVDVEAIEELKHCQTARQRISDTTFQESLHELRSRDRIAYAEIWSLKLEVLKMLYLEFQSELLESDSARTKSFRQFQQDGGEDLYRFAVFETLQSFFHQQDPSIETWQQWPQEFQDPDSDTTTQWAQASMVDIEFYQYLQWNCDQQLAAIYNRCKTVGMHIGIYRDLAVGDDIAGASCWADQSHYALDMGVGAPPDDFNLKGQNWGLPPPRPEARFTGFIQTLRANMRHAGALRIDHVMGLMRLFWVPPGCAPDQGTYVAYPFAELLGILALESQRNECMIVGEDLGTVPDEVRHALYISNILSYRILHFEKHWDTGTIKAPGEYPRHALCATGSHDLPTLRGFWQGIDLELRERLDLFPSEEIKQSQYQLRQQDREQILAALARENLLVDGSSDTDNETVNDLSSDLCLAIQRYLARSESVLLMVQAEDLLAQVEQVNLPGTVNEYPNWRCKLPLELEEWVHKLDLEDFARAINSERSG